MSRTFLVVGLLVALSSFYATDAELNCDIGKFVQSSDTFAELIKSEKFTTFMTATTDKPPSVRGIVVKGVQLGDQWSLTETLYFTNGSCLITVPEFFRLNMVKARMELSNLSGGLELNHYMLAGDKDTGYLWYSEVLKDGFQLSDSFSLVSLSPRGKVDPQIAEKVLASICDPPVDVQSLFQDLEVDPNVMDGSCTM